LGICLVATTLPSTFSVPVPGRPMPLKLLKASVPDAQAVVLEVEFDGVRAWRQSLRALPLQALQIDQVPQEHRLALEQVEAIAAKASAGGQDHALGPTLPALRCRR
jgi:hypothetical protein